MQYADFNLRDIFTFNFQANLSTLHIESCQFLWALWALASTFLNEKWRVCEYELSLTSVNHPLLDFHYQTLYHDSPLPHQKVWAGLLDNVPSQCLAHPQRLHPQNFRILYIRFVIENPENIFNIGINFIDIYLYCFSILHFWIFIFIFSR